MHTKTRLTLALLAALGLTGTGALATTNSMPADPEKLQSLDITQPFGPRAKPAVSGTLPGGDVQVAEKGRGKDGTKPEDDGVDLDDGFDDDGIDPLPHAAAPRGGLQVAEKGRGKDGTKPEDDGVDIDDGCDDNGIDGACV